MNNNSYDKTLPRPHTHNAVGTAPIFFLRHCAWHLLFEPQLGLKQRRLLGFLLDSLHIRELKVKAIVGHSL